MIVDNTYPDIRVERQARALVRRGHEVEIICLRGPGEPKRAVADGIRVHRVPIRRERGMGLRSQATEYVAFLLYATALATVLHQRRPFDVVQAHNVPDFLIFAGLVPKLNGARLLLDLHDLMPEFFASRFGGRLDSLPVRAVLLQERLSAGFADHVITVTELWRQTLIARGLQASKVDVVMNVPDETLFPRRDPREHAGGPVTILYHGTLTHRYGVDLLVRAFARVAQDADVRMILHGRGELIPELEALIRDLDLGALVRLSTDMLPTADLPKLIAEADIGVVPNRLDVFTDGILPTKLMEYVALGVPAVVSRSSATTAYFDDSMVRYVPPGDVDALAMAIRDLVNDPEGRLSLARRAQRFAEEHRWEREADRYVEIVERLASTPAR
ncbi:MAG TPA: glycosyltransferase family 4 protein [Candidatus Limnocylindria bacterium]|nr:glycosyltransferase family 4 protein [Candidatus Limnocylindria bacterium]